MHAWFVEWRGFGFDAFGTSGRCANDLDVCTEGHACNFPIGHSRSSYVGKLIVNRRIRKLGFEFKTVWVREIQACREWSLHGKLGGR